MDLAQQGKFAVVFGADAGVREVDRHGPNRSSMMILLFQPPVDKPDYNVFTRQNAVSHTFSPTTAF
eukprot:scaffold4724_cov166-Amphora_coffeaeformis.AAC.3